MTAPEYVKLLIKPLLLNNLSALSPSRAGSEALTAEALTDR